MNKFEYDNFGKLLKYLSDGDVEGELDGAPLDFDDKEYTYDKVRGCYLNGEFFNKIWNGKSETMSILFGKDNCKYERNKQNGNWYKMAS